MLWAHSLACPNEMHAFTGIRIGSLQKHSYAHDLEIIKAGSSSGGASSGQIIAPKKYIDILGGAHGGRAFRRYPQRPLPAADHSVQPTCLFQCIHDSL